MPPSTFSLFAAVLGTCPIVPLHSDIESAGFERIDEPFRECRSHPVIGGVSTNIWPVQYVIHCSLALN